MNEANLEKADRVRLESRAHSPHPSERESPCQLEAMETFIRDLVHEIRTPLGQLASLSDLLLHRGSENDNTKKLLAIQAATARGMMDLVETLLDLARPTGAPELREVIDLTELTSSVARDVLTDHPGGPPVEWHIQEGMAVYGSLRQIRLVMRNLLSNAVKYSSMRTRSEIAISLEATPGFQSITVRDNGLGFTEEGALALFSPFTRLAATSSLEGLGLGLSLVKRIVARHGGAVSAHGQAGNGAAFSFSLPIATVAAR